MPSLASTLGRLIRPLRPGLSSMTGARFGAPRLSVMSAFGDGADMPVRFTADGAGLSPPLHWTGVPSGAVSLAILVEDVDAPFPQPLVHLLLYGVPPELTGLEEGAVPRRAARSRLFTAGRTSFGARGWLPPSPIPGHGPHRYACQVFALSRRFTPPRVAGRGALRMALRDAVLGWGVVIGTYERP